jgi:hypothetical protein
LVGAVSIAEQNGDAAHAEALGNIAYREIQFAIAV